MADEKVILDCATGEIARGPLSPVEQDQKRADTELHVKRMNDEDTEESARKNVLGKLAKAAGLTVEEITDALGTGGRSLAGGQRPDRTERDRVPVR